MIVQKNNRFRKPTYNHVNENQDRISGKLTNPQRIMDEQKRPAASGSRFAIFDVEEECLERASNMEEQREQRGNEPAVSLDNLEELQSIKREDNEELQQGIIKENTKMEQSYIHSKEQASSSKPKGNNIMEKFIKTKGKEKSTSSGILKANVVGVFKTQKTKKMNN